MELNISARFTETDPDGVPLSLLLEGVQIDTGEPTMEDWRALLMQGVPHPLAILYLRAVTVDPAPHAHVQLPGVILGLDETGLLVGSLLHEWERRGFGPRLRDIVDKVLAMAKETEEL